MSDRKQPKRLGEAAEYGLLIAGSLIIALSFNLFLRPNQIASGGISGISIIVQYSLGVQPAITQWVLNIPLFIAGWLLLGRQFGYKTAAGSFILPLFVYFTSGLPALSRILCLPPFTEGWGSASDWVLFFLEEDRQGDWIWLPRLFISMRAFLWESLWLCWTAGDFGGWNRFYA